MRNDPLIRRIKKRLKATGRTARAVSMAATGSPDALRSILNGRTMWPRSDTASALASELGTTEAWLLREEGPEELSGEVAMPAPESVTVDQSTPGRTRMFRDVPLMGTAAGSHVSGAIQLLGVIDFVERPATLLQRPCIYALRIVGDSMMPAHNPGDLRYVDPYLNASPGSTVIVQTMRGAMDDIEASIGILKARTTDSVLLEKLNPAGIITFNAKNVLAVHAVV